MPRAYSIHADDIAAERERVDDVIADIDVSRVIKLDELELREMGPRDVPLRILAVSAEHNVDHAALADTTNIAEARGGKIYPGNSAVAEVIETGGQRFTDSCDGRSGETSITHQDAIVGVS